MSVIDPTDPQLPSNRRLPGRLMDTATIAREYGISRAAAEAVMRGLPKVQPDGLRKTYCWRTDVEAYFRDRTGR